MIEVEVKLPVNDRENLIQSLRKAGFAKRTSVRETDTYYTSDFHDMIKRDEALRIREICNLESEECCAVITYKGSKMDSVSMTREEYETSVGDAKTAKRILEGIGFASVPVVEKTRTTYEKQDISACVDQVRDLGDFLELEILTQVESREEALARIEDVLEQLGYTMADTTRRSYLSMLMGLEE